MLGKTGDTCLMLVLHCVLLSAPVAAHNGAVALAYPADVVNDHWMGYCPL